VGIRFPSALTRIAATRQGGVMPTLSLSAWVIWGAVFAPQTALIIMMIQNGMYRRWPSVFAFLCVQSLQAVLMLGIVLRVSDPDLQPFLTFWTYWIGAFVSQVIEVWIIVQLCCALVGERTIIKRWLRGAVPSLAVLSLGCSLLLSIDTKAHIYDAAVRAVTLMDKSVTLGWLSMFLVIALGADFLEISWPPIARGIAVGLAVELSGEMMTTWLSDGQPRSALISNLKGSIYICTVLIWTVSIRRKTSNNCDSVDAERFSAYLETYFLALKRIKGITS
jgi:hypothetical protein